MILTTGLAMPQLLRSLSLLHCLLLVNAVMFPVLVVAAHADSENKIVSPDTIDGVTNVDADSLIELVISTPTLVLIDSRITADRKEGYIEGSVSLPDIDTTCDTLGDNLPDLGIGSVSHWLSL